MTFNNEPQGAEVTKCVKIVDWNTKKLTDAVEVADRLPSGCCPSGFTYGAQPYGQASQAYLRGMIICGYDANGGIQTINTGTTCSIGKCYLMKPSANTCADGSAMRLNTCCSDTGGNANFPTAAGTCKYSGVSTSNSQTTCSSYQLKAGTSTWDNTLGTTSATDDIVNNKLVWDKVRRYGFCGLDGSAAASVAHRPVLVGGGLILVCISLFV